MFHRLLGAAPGEAGAGGHYRGPDSSRWGRPRLRRKESGWVGVAGQQGAL